MQLAFFLCVNLCVCVCVRVRVSQEGVCEVIKRLHSDTAIAGSDDVTRLDQGAARPFSTKTRERDEGGETREGEREGGWEGGREGRKESQISNLSQLDSDLNKESLFWQVFCLSNEGVFVNHGNVPMVEFFKPVFCFVFYLRT